MRLAMHLLLMVCLGWCGLHAAEPAQAHAAAAAANWTSDCDRQGDTQERSAHLHHHHCPVAADPCRDAGQAAPTLDAAPPFAAGTASLRSLTRAPPVEPPSA
jgi:hypothetical protein